MNTLGIIDPTEPGTVRLATLMTGCERGNYYAQAARAAVAAKRALSTAYRAYSREHCQDQIIQRGGPDWDAMMLATAAEYRTLQRAKAAERRAKAKLLAFFEGV